MKYILYLCYIIEKVVYWWLHILDKKVPTDHNDKKKIVSDRILSNATCNYTQWVYCLGEFLYLTCILCFLYLIGFTQTELLLKEENKYITLIAIMCIVTPFDNWLFKKNDRYQKYSAEFAQFSSKQKFKYGTVALVLFLLPIVTLIIEFVCF